MNEREKIIDINQKEYGIEVLRIILMIFIVSHHVIVHGFGFSALKIDEWHGLNTNILSIYNAFFIVGVNVFFLISGYFGIKRNLNKVFNLHLQCIFYSLIVSCFIKDFVKVNDIIKSIIIPEFFYWFIFVYIILIFLAPYMNRIIEDLDKREYIKIIFCWLLLIFVFDFLFSLSFLGYHKGYSLLHGCFMYFVGGFFKKKYFKISTKKRIKAAICYVCSSLLLGTLSICAVHLNKQAVAWNFYSYSNPLVILASISLFICFINIQNNLLYRYIRPFSKGVLAAYLITEFWPMRKIIYSPIVNFSQGIWYIIPYAILIVIVSSSVDLIRDYIFKCIFRICRIKKG